MFAQKTNMKKQYFFLFLFFLSLKLSAQVAGISASKLATYDAVLLPKYALEVEPSFSYLYSRQWFNVDSHSVPYNLGYDSSLLMTNFNMRFTYGVGNNLEMGAFVNSISATSLLEQKCACYKTKIQDWFYCWEQPFLTNPIRFTVIRVFMVNRFLWQVASLLPKTLVHAFRGIPIFRYNIP